MVKIGRMRHLINSALDLDLANPNLQISEKESLLRDRAIELGCLDYFRTFPLRLNYVTTYSTTGDATGTFSWTGVTPPHVENGETFIYYDDLLTGAVPAIADEDLEHAYFLGVIRMERPYFGNYSNPSLWSLQMFGYNMTTAQFATDPMKILLNNTYDDLSTGQPSYVLDNSRQRLVITPPFGIGQLSIQVAVGYDDPEYADFSKVDILSKFISYRFIEAIIQARDGVQFEADFKISTDALQKRLERLHEQLDSVKNHALVAQQATWS